MHVIDLWEEIRKGWRFLRIRKHIPGSLEYGSAFENVISICLDRLNSCSAGNALYLLSCLCPEDFQVILDLVRLDLNQPHEQKYSKDIYCRRDPREDLLPHLHAYMNIIPAKDRGRLWLELTRRWLLSCPIPPTDDKAEESGKDLLCQKLQSELIERILRID